MHPAVARKLLVTGANGFLGRAVAAMLPASWDAVALLRCSSQDASPGFSVVAASIEELQRCVRDLDCVLHLAACIPPDPDNPDPELRRVNIDLVSRLAEAYPEARHVHASSVSVYGVPKTLPLTATSEFRQASRYGLSKLAGECIVRQLPQHAVIRFSSIIGKGMRPDSFVPAAVAAARAGSIQLHGNGQRLQNYVDVRDAARMCLRAIERDDCFVTLGISPRSYSNLEVAQLLRSITSAAIIHAGSDCSPSYAYALEDAVDLGPCTHTLADTLAGMVAG